MLALLALPLAWWQYAAAPQPPAPDLLLGLAAWVAVAGYAQHSLPRLWVIGLCRELADPASGGFQVVGLVLVGLLLQPLARLLPPRRLWAWAVWAAAAWLLLQLAEGWLSGWTGVGFWASFGGLLATALLAPLVGWLAEGLPRRLCPLAARELW